MNDLYINMDSLIFLEYYNIKKCKNVKNHLNNRKLQNIKESKFYTCVQLHSLIIRFCFDIVVFIHV
jgi:hypothetical protein